MTGKILSIQDNPEYFDRYTVVIDEPWKKERELIIVNRKGTVCRVYRKVYSAIGMNEDPNHPQGFYQHTSAMRGRHLGKRITFEELPFQCQKALVQEFKP